MKANRHVIIRNDRGEVGIGTLIVFIAMVLVAAVAAGVIINTSGALQQRAQKAGSAATQQVSSTMQVQGVYGKVADNGKLGNVYFYVSLAPGATDINISELRMRFTDGVNAPRYMSATGSAGTPGTPTASEFGAEWLRSQETGGSQVIQSTDLVQLEVNLTTIGPSYELESSTSVAWRFLPAVGVTVDADFTTPASYGSKLYVTIR